MREKELSAAGVKLIDQAHLVVRWVSSLDEVLSTEACYESLSEDRCEYLARTDEDVILYHSYNI